MKSVALGELMPSRIPGIDPRQHPAELFTLWSIPSFDAGAPVPTYGRDIGSNKKLVQSGDVILSKIVPHIRRAWTVRANDNNVQIASSEWIIFRDSRFLSDYVRHFLLSDVFHQQFMGTVAGVGGSLLRAQPQSVAKIMIPLPPIEEQARIVALLDRAAAIRRRAEAAREKTRSFIPALFAKMFGDPLTNPKGWDELELGQAIRSIDGGKNLQAGDDYNQLRILKVSAVTSGTLKPEESKPVPNGYLPPSSHMVRKGDFLFSRANTADLVGATAIVEREVENLVLPDKIWRISWHEQLARPAFMLAYMQSKYFRGVMSSIASGTSDSMKNISQAKLKTLPVMIPPIERQLEFERLFASATTLTRSLDEGTKISLKIQKALSAEVFA